jgi:hypothetical protein
LFEPQAFVMNKTSLSFWMTLAGTVCWGVCFWWMRRLSIKQNFLLDQLREQGRRIEKLSKVEHDLIKEVHPQVSEIKAGMDEMMAAVKENSKPAVAPSRKKKLWFARRDANS